MPCYQRKLAKGIRWYYKFDLNGTTYHSKCIYNTKAEAKQAEAQALNGARQADRIIKTLSLHDAIKDRLSYLKQVKSYKYFIDSKRYLEGFFNSINYDLSVCDVNDWHISTFLMEFSKELQLKKKKNYGVNSAIRCLKSFFNYIINKYGFDFKNPVRQEYYPIDKRLKYIPPDNEIDAVLNKCDAGQRQLVEFVRDTGCRIGEALRLTADDVFEDYIVFYTRKSKNSNLTPRKVPKPDCLIDIKESRIFSRWSNTPDFLDEKVVALGFKRWSWHNLRHRYASKLSKAGVPIFEIMSLLGHSNLSTTQNYLQLLP